jgi:hypothetical protein
MTDVAPSQVPLTLIQVENWLAELVAGEPGRR